MTRRSVKRSALVAGVALLATAAGCTAKPDSQQPHGDPADAYTVVIRWFVDNAASTDGNQIVFVEAGGEGWVIELETQAAVIAATEKFADIRFIDDRSEALDGDSVRDDGLLLALRPAFSEGTTATIICDQILGGEVVLSWLFELEYTAGVWQLRGDPTPVP